MATELATAYVSLVPSLKGASATIGKELGGIDMSGAGRSIGASLTNGIGGSLAGLSGKLGAIAGIASSVGSAAIGAFANLSGEIVSASDSAQKFGSTLSFAGVSTQEIQKLTKSTQDYADKTVFGLADIRNTTAQLAANGVPNYDKLAEAAGNLTAVAGGGANEFRSVAMALTQTAGAGKLTTENWNQLADAIPGASGKLQQAMKANGAYTGDFRDAMANGEITADEFNQALLQLGLSDVAVEAASSASTIEGATGNLEASMVKLGSTLLDTVKPALTGVMNWAADGFTAATPIIQSAVQGAIGWISQLWAKLENNGAVTAFKAAWDTIRDAIMNVVNMVVDWTHVAPPDGLADMIKKVALAFQGLASLLINGDFTSALREAFNIDEDSPLVTMLLAARDAVLNLTPALGTLTGDTTALKLALAGIVAVKGYEAVNNGLAGIASAAAGVKTAAEGITNAFNGLGGIGGQLSKMAGSIQIVKNAQSAWSASTQAASAAQTAFGAVVTQSGKGLSTLTGLLTKNPFGALAAGIAVVVAGLVLFFTQTETGRQAWQQFMQFLQPLWDGVQAAWNAALPALQSLMQSLGDTLGSVVKTVGPVLQQLGPLFQQALGGLTQTLGPVVQQLGPAFQQLLAPIQANLPALQAAFGQLGTAFQTSFQTIMPAVQQLGATFMQLLPTFMQLGTTLMQAGAQIGAALAPAIAQIMATLAQLAPVIMQIITQIVSAVVPVITTITQLIAQLAPVIAQIVTTLVGVLVPVIQMIATAIAAVLPLIMQIVTTLVGMLVPVITAIVQVITALLPIVTSVVTGIISVVQPILAAIVGVIQGVITVIQGVITFLTGVFTGDWQQAWQGIQQIFQGVWQAIQSVVTGIWNAIQAAIQAGLNVIQSVWNSIWNAVSNVAKTIWDGIRNAIQAAIQNVQNVIQSVLNSIQNVWNSIWNAVSSTVSSIWNQVTSTVSNGVNNVLNFVQSIPGKIMGFFSNAGSMLVNAGGQIIQGLWNGISGAIGGLYSNIKNALSGLVDQAKSALGIHSPSRVFRDQIGLMIGEGMALGITDSGKSLSGAVDDMLDQAMPSARHGLDIQTNLTGQTGTANNRTDDETARLTEALTRALAGLPLVRTYTDERAAAIALAPAMNARLGQLKEMGV